MACKNSWFQADRAHEVNLGHASSEVDIMCLSTGGALSTQLGNVRSEEKKQWLYTFRKHEKKQPHWSEPFCNNRRRSCGNWKKGKKNNNLRTKDVTNVWHERTKRTLRLPWDWNSFYLSLCRSFVPFLSVPWCLSVVGLIKTAAFPPAPFIWTDPVHWCPFCRIAPSQKKWAIRFFPSLQGFFIVFHPDRMETSADRRHH